MTCFYCPIWNLCFCVDFNPLGYLSIKCVWSPGNHSNQCCWLSHQVRANKTIHKHLLHSCKREFAFDYMITVLHLVLHIVGEGTPISPTHHPFGRIVAFLERASCYEQKRRKFTFNFRLFCSDVNALSGRLNWKKRKSCERLTFFCLYIWSILLC